MNYYIQGNPNRAKEIKAAFEKLGYSTNGWNYNGKCGVYFTNECDKTVDFTQNEIFVNLIKTHPDYKELPIVSKFKVGDWVVFNNNHNSIYQISEVKNSLYVLTHTHGGSMTLSFSQEELIRPWSIADAKDGDVLVTNSIICIFKKLDKDGYIISPCIYTVKGGLEVIDDENDSIGSYVFKPATKEDRELLFRKIKEAGYMWDEKKKELCKIQHYDISNFYAGMPVLVRETSLNAWQYVPFSHCYTSSDGSTRFNASAVGWSQCIPFNDDTKHLLGTTDMCPKEYINW